MRTLITGASGFVGRHVADACLRRQWPIHVLARSTSDLGQLETQAGVSVFRGELHDPAMVRQALGDVDAVIHCAAKVGDWGPVEVYRLANVEALRVLLEACKGLGLSRFIHMSSLGVYPPRHHYGSDEATPLPKKHRDGYTQSKVESEQLALRYHRDFGVPVVALRPGFVYGPGDRAVMPRIIENLRTGFLRYPGGGGQALNTIFVRNLVDAVFLAFEHENAVGQAINLTDGERVTKRQFIEKICDALHLPQTDAHAADVVCLVSDVVLRKTLQVDWGQVGAPIQLARLKFMGLNLDFSIAKAQTELGYRPRVTFDDAMAETMAWYRAQG